MKLILIVGAMLCTGILLSFTGKGGKLKGERVFTVIDDRDVHVSREGGTIVAEPDAMILQKYLVGFVACETQSVINQCSTKLVSFSADAYERRMVQAVIDKYNGPDGTSEKTK